MCRGFLILAIVALTNCSVAIEDKRLPREEVVQAFKERDSLFTGIAKLLKDHEERIKKLEAK